MKNIMNKNNLVKILAIGIIVLIFALVGVKRYIIPLIGSQSINETSTDENSKYSQMVKEKQNFIEFQKNSKDSSTVYLLNRKYVILDTGIQKELPEGLSEKNLRDTVMVKDGSIENEYSIVWITYTLQSYSDMDKLETLNSNQIRIKSDDKTVKLFEPVMMNPSEFDVDSSNHFHLNITDKDEKQITLYFCIPDSCFDEAYRMVFYLNPSGINELHLNPGDIKEMYVAEVYIDSDWKDGER